MSEGDKKVDVKKGGEGTSFLKPDGKFFKVDLHTHILPKHLPDLGKKYGYGGWISVHTKTGSDEAHMEIDGKPFRTVSCNCWNPEARLSDCIEPSVDVQVLSTVPVLFNYWAKPEHTLDLAKYLNDDIAQTCASWPGRFVGLATLPMQAPELAVGELRRCVKELGLRGVQIGSHVNEWNLDAPELEPVWTACEELDVPVFIHPWDMDQKGYVHYILYRVSYLGFSLRPMHSSNSKIPFLSLSLSLSRSRMSNYWFPWLIGMPCETTTAICSLIFGGVLERHPSLRVALAHGGGSFPYTLGRIEHGFRVRPDLCAVRCQKSPL
ncbi:hypothetical protein HK102_009967 [Quaeritorhiza haematococci]|nr:hypothetical protein HK102_009967 [Quaeritorhiza haematococci]